MYMWQGWGGQQFSFYYLFILNFRTLNCLQFKPKLFSLYYQLSANKVLLIKGQSSEHDLSATKVSGKAKKAN